MDENKIKHGNSARVGPGKDIVAQSLGSVISNAINRVGDVNIPYSEDDDAAWGKKYADDNRK